MKNRRRLVLLLALLLCAAAFSALLAFRIGQNRSVPLSAEASRIETGEPVAAVYKAGCDLLGQPASIVAPNFIVECRPEGGRKEGALIVAAAREPRGKAKTIFDIPITPRETPLDNAVMAAVAGQGVGPGAGNPLRLAMAPNGGPTPQGSIFDGATGWPSGGGGGGGIPPRLIPGGGGGGNPPPGGTPNGDGPSGDPGPGGPTGKLPPKHDDPDDELPPPFKIPDGTPDPINPPDLVTPVPGALPLMMTGLVGFLFARRRKPAS